MYRRAARHADRVRRMSKISKNRKKRGVRWQVEKREMERGIRKNATAFVRWQARCGRPHEDAARDLGISHVTLADWRRRWCRTRLRAYDRGRPLSRPDVAMRNRVIAQFDHWGPHLGLPTLKQEFPAVARRELADLQRRYRGMCRRTKTVCVHALHWTCPGTVWAFDYTEPPYPVDGLYPYILVVRDLASGKQLAAQSVAHENAEATIALLTALFNQYGPPLVIKSDNGSPLVAEDVRKLLETHGVLRLLSPPCTPAYNGACEAGIGSLKSRAHLIAARQGRPGRWTANDVEAARMLANETVRPRGHLAPTPDQAWGCRPALALDMRKAFTITYRHMETQARNELNQEAKVAPGPFNQARVDRLAIPRTLRKHGFLFVTRRRISLRLKKRFWTKIS